MIHLTHKDLQRLGFKNTPKPKKEEQDEYAFVNSPHVRHIMNTNTFVDEIGHDKHKVMNEVD